MILNNGDTVRGYIDYQHYTPCRFSEKRGRRNIIKYSPDDLKGYGFADGRYLMSKEYFDSKTGERKKDFLEVLLLGEISLYVRKGEPFVETADTIINLKPGKKKVVQTENKGLRLSQRKTHYGVLNYLFRDCPSVTAKLKKIKPHPENILKILEDYYKCRGTDYRTFISTTPQVRVNFGIEAGVVSSGLAYYSDGGDSYSPDYLKTTLFSPAGKLYFSFPRTRDRFSFVLGVQYLQGNYPVKVQFQRNGAIYYAESAFVAKRLKIPFGFYYNFSKGSVTPFVGLGLLSAIKLSSSSKYILEVESGDVVDTYTGQTSPFLDKTGNIWLAGGVKVKITKKIKAYVEIRVEGPYSTLGIAADVLNGNMAETSFMFGIMF